MKDSSTKFQDWPAKSPDLNIVKDIWKLLSIEIYDGPQFLKVNNVKEKINEVIRYLNETKREMI